jgi:hypothetical protein
MNLFFGFFGLPTWLVVFVLLILTSAAALAPVIIKRRVRLERLVLNNEVAGFKYATLGVFYCVRLGFRRDLGMGAVRGRGGERPRGKRRP